MDWQKTLGDGLSLVRKRLPSWPYLLAALAIWILFQWLGTTEILGPLHRFTESLLADLQVLSPLNVIGAYYYHLTGCGAEYVDGSITANCNNAGGIFEEMRQFGVTGWFAFALSPGFVLWDTAATVWDNSGWMGRIIYLMTLPVGAFGAREAVIAMSDNQKSFTGRRIPEDWTIFGWVLFVALIPAIAGLAALALQWLLIVIIWIFGMALAAIVWIFAVFATPIAFARNAFGIVKDASELEKGYAVLKDGPKDPGGHA